MRLNQKGYKPKYINGTINVFLDENSNKKFEVFLRPYTSDSKVFEQVIINKEYFTICELIASRNLSKNIKFIVDAGANIGMTSIYFLSHFENAQIISIEPDTDNFKQLKLNIAHNSLESRVRILFKALWINKTDDLIITNDFRDGDSWSKSVAIQKTENNSIKISPVTLSDILALNSDSSYIDILKIDVEGTECSLFNDDFFLELLNEHVKFLCLEIHEETGCLKRITDFLDNNNFEVIFKNQTFFCVNKSLLKEER